MNETGVQDLSLLAVVTAMVRDGVIVVGVLIVVMVHRGLILFGWVRRSVGLGWVGSWIRSKGWVGFGWVLGLGFGFVFRSLRRGLRCA